MYKSKVIAGIEIGTGKVTVLVGEIVDGRRLNVIGLGQSSSQGVLKGEIIDFHQASDCAHAAILSAETQAGVSIDGVYLAQSGAHVEGIASDASVGVSWSDGRVRTEDLEQLSALALSKDLPDERTVIHNLKRPFVLDGKTVNSPVGMEGQKLEASYWTVHGDARRISDTIHIINGFNLHVDDIILSGLASSAVVASPEERANGALVIDIGRGTTDYALYTNGKCVVAGCLPLGGDHISNDLSIGLRMRLKQAESLKFRYGSAVVEHQNKSEKVWLNNDFEIGDRPIPLWSIEKIIEMRTTEIFEIVRKKLGYLYRAERLSGGVILCGGSSRLRNIENCASKVFDAPARIGDNAAMASGELKDPQYSTALGLLHYGLQIQSEKSVEHERQNGLLGRLKGLFLKG